MFNGLANSAVQTGFETIDLTSYVQTNSIGADMTAAAAGGTTITGTGYADTLRGTAGNNTSMVVGVMTLSLVVQVMTPSLVVLVMTPSQQALVLTPSLVVPRTL